MERLLSIDGVVRSFGDVAAVANASLDVHRGEVVALLGPSGCGKTTLLRLIGGLEVPDAGSIAVDGTVLSADGIFVPPERRQIGMVFQDYALFPHISVGGNVAFGLPRGVDKKARIAEMLELVGLGGLQDRMPHKLSGGQQQRVAIARALAASPRLLLLDEPFSNLDPASRTRVRLEVRELIARVGITAIFVTHDQDEALSLADRVAVMMDGRILQAGTPREIYDEPAARSVAEFVGQPNFLRGEATGDRVTVELGTLLLAEPATGPVDVMIRAEDLVQVATGGAEATVTDVRYFGHEEVVTLELPSGVTLRARWRGSEQVTPGDHLRVAICGTVRAYAVP